MKNEFKAALVVIGVIIIILGAKYLTVELSTNGVKIKTDEILIKKESKVTKKIQVHISGEVKFPGVYELEENARINDLIKLAGELTDYADISRVNLAKILNDEDKIIVYKIKDSSESVEYFAIDIINYSTIERLLEIDGIGEVLAKRIIKYRDENGIFSKYEELLNVEGIGEGKLKIIIDSIEWYFLNIYLK